MKENFKKFVFIVISIFLSFLFFTDVKAENGDNGIIISSFEYDINNDLTLSWGVEDGYENFYAQALYNTTGQTRTLQWVGIVDQSKIGYPARIRIFNDGWGYIDFFIEAMDCVEYYDENVDVLKIDVADFGTKTCSMKFTSIDPQYGNNIYPSSGSYIKKSDIDNGFYNSNFLENIYVPLDFIDSNNFTYNWYVQNDVQLLYNEYGDTSQPYYVLTYETTFPIEGTSPPVDGLCGEVDGTTFDYADVESLEFCSAGDFFTITGPVDGYFPYSCQGINGGSTDYCESYYYINGECGTADGGYFSTSPETSTLCSSESYLIFPSFVETSSGWTWICGGYYGGTQSYCSAYLTGTSYPSLPEEEDCSSYTIPDKWICEIKNIFNGAFLPSEAKLNELNIAINSFQTKAPFNYLSSASNILNNVKNGISEDDLSITIMQNTSQVNLNDIEAFTSIIKTFFTILLIFAFLFWGINYIKHFFR